MTPQQPDLLSEMPSAPTGVTPPEASPRYANDGHDDDIDVALTHGVPDFPNDAVEKLDQSQSGAIRPRNSKRADKRTKRSFFESTAVASRERLVRRPEVEHLTGLSRSSLYRLIDAKEFPPSIKLSKSAAAWPLSAVEAWISARVAGAQKNRSDSGEV